MSNQREEDRNCIDEDDVTTYTTPQLFFIKILFAHTAIGKYREVLFPQGFSQSHLGISGDIHLTILSENTNIER